MTTTPGKWYVERHDQDDGTINYEIWSVYTEQDGGTNMHRIGTLNDDDNENAKEDAALIIKGVNHVRGF